MTTLDWYGCATFRLRTAGLTIFLDAYIDRVPGAAGTGLTADDDRRVRLDRRWGIRTSITCGAPSASCANTPRDLVGSYETIRVMEAPACRSIA